MRDSGCLLRRLKYPQVNWFKEIKMIYDVIIIGAGVVGGAIARNLSRFELSVLALEKEADICCGTSKANTGIIHSPGACPFRNPKS